MIDTLLQPQTLVPILIFAAVLLAMTSLYLVASRRSTYRGQVNQRLFGDMPVAEATEGVANVRLPRATGVRDYRLPMLIAFNRLVLQSGIRWGASFVLSGMTVLAFVTFLVALYLGLATVVALAVSVGLGILLPLHLLRTMRTRRQRKFEQQLPDAMDTMVRSLRAGHTIPVAISAVGKEMLAPLGEEFSITAAELTYGLDLETALGNLRTRVGQSDLALVVVAVSIQAKLGGNLTEILANLSRIVRQRFKLRRKARALSAEGRFSAVFLSILPWAVFAILWVVAPNYYGDVWQYPFVKLILVAAIGWMLIGNIIMYRMVRFDV